MTNIDQGRCGKSIEQHKILIKKFLKEHCVGKKEIFEHFDGANCHQDVLELYNDYKNTYNLDDKLGARKFNQILQSFDLESFESLGKVWYKWIMSTKAYIRHSDIFGDTTTSPENMDAEIMDNIVKNVAGFLKISPKLSLEILENKTIVRIYNESNVLDWLNTRNASITKYYNLRANKIDKKIKDLFHEKFCEYISSIEKTTAESQVLYYDNTTKTNRYKYFVIYHDFTYLENARDNDVENLNKHLYVTIYAAPFVQEKLQSYERWSEIDPEVHNNCCIVFQYIKGYENIIQELIKRTKPLRENKIFYNKQKEKFISSYYEYFGWENFENSGEIFDDSDADFQYFENVTSAT